MKFQRKSKISNGMVDFSTILYHFHGGAMSRSRTLLNCVVCVYAISIYIFYNHIQSFQG